MEMDHIKDMRVKGVGKFIHSILMFLTYPVRHVFKFLAFLFVLLVILAAIPMVQGVSYRHILDWYLLRYNQVEEKVAGEIKVIETGIPTGLQKQEIIEEVSAPRVIRKRAVHNKEDIERRVFKRPFVKLPEQEAAAKSAEVAFNPDNLPKENITYYRKVEGLPLVYEDEPKEIEGKTIVFSANEMAVGDTYVVLYGVYTDAKKVDANQALRYLRELAEGKQVTCKIVAYTYENIATGVCFLDGRSINQNLVDAGLADNIAL